MKKNHRIVSLLLAALMAFGLLTTAFAATDSAPTIDTSKKASLSIYKYDITTAGKDGAWDVESYVSTGLHDDAVIDKLSKYAIQGVEFTYLRVADVTTSNDLLDGQRQVGVLYGFDSSERSNAVLSAIGITGADAYKTENGINYFTSDMLNNKLATAPADCQCHHREECAGNCREERRRGYDRDGCHRPHFCIRHGAGVISRRGDSRPRKRDLHLQSFLRVLAHDPH